MIYTVFRLEQATTEESLFSFILCVHTMTIVASWESRLTLFMPCTMANNRMVTLAKLPQWKQNP